MDAGKRWSVQDRYGNAIYLTQERWEHVIAPMNHPEMQRYEAYLQAVIRSGTRRQDMLNPQKYRYLKTFDDLTADNTHIVAIVLFRFEINPVGQLVPNNYIVTAYQKEIG